MNLTVNREFYFTATVRELKISRREFKISRRVHSCSRNFHSERENEDRRIKSRSEMQRSEDFFTL